MVNEVLVPPELAAVVIGDKTNDPYGLIVRLLTVPLFVVSTAVVLPNLVVEFLIAASPDVAPRVSVVAAPPIDKLVAVVFISVAVASVVVISPPFTARSPATVTVSVVLLKVRPESPPRFPPSLN